MKMGGSEKFLYLLAGTGIGATLGILFAPNSGHEFRNTLSTKAQRGVDLLSGKVEDGKKYIRERGGSVRKMVDRGKQTFDESVQAVKNRFNESIETGRQAYQAHRVEPDERM